MVSKDSHIDEPSQNHKFLAHPCYLKAGLKSSNPYEEPSCHEDTSHLLKVGSLSTSLHFG
ncbi:hypothetical protein MtrunA17_Chr8g0377081 [Medicago truncatula]|uniref:Uncharacterized protein n=1 Tax=Medicago truncatula TaxID=3880 RepID=A0A396GUI2_MEDTR|nr:hypothetical protein MtrunA17_Chr8g0377081 [Medicago truncatula]